MTNERPLAKEERREANRDPLSGAPGSHPVGTAVGAAAGGVAAGAAIGTVAGPVGTLVGGAVGAVIGGLAGKGIAEQIDPTAEDAYWSQHYNERPYVGGDYGYGDYGPAYRYGVDAYGRYPTSSFDEVDAELDRGWGEARGSSRLDWSDARHAARDSWQRVSDAVERAAPGDADRDGR